MGSLVVQMAKAAGARVATSVGSPQKIALCQSLGADLALSYKTDDIPARLREFAPDGVDVWYETQREPNLEVAIPLLRKRGRMILMAGRTARPALPLGAFYPRDCSLLGFAVWFVFGESVLGSLTADHLGAALGYAVLSLTVLRMVPVALSLIGMHLPWDTVALAGWLGPRGLASIIFAMLADDAIGGADGALVLTVVGTTVAVSVLAHGLSAGPLAVWYSARHPADEAPTSA